MSMTSDAGRRIGSAVSSLAESIRETLPADEREAGVFLAGACWAFVLFWSMLIFVTYLWSRSTGAP
jgi:hypothetical protein